MAFAVKITFKIKILGLGACEHGRLGPFELSIVLLLENENE